ncbi:hypothetical protein K2X85_14545 [bacterium]|nr:hypothetical protein [bacterium]
MFGIRPFATMLVALLTVSSSMHAAVITLTPIMDGTYLTTKTTGNPAVETVDTTQLFLLSQRDVIRNAFSSYVSGNENRIGMEFDLSVLSSLGPVTSAVLLWTELVEVGSPNTHNLRGADGTGSLSFSNWSSSALLGNANDGTIDSPASFDVTSTVQQFDTNGNQYGRFFISSGNGNITSAGGGNFRSRVSPYQIASRLSATPPQLVITTVPEAGSLVLLGMGSGICLVARMLRRSARG